MKALTFRFENSKIKLLSVDRRLREFGSQIHTLLSCADVSCAKATDFHDVLDYALGALYSLMWAEALDYADRLDPYELRKYREETLFPRAMDTNDGWLRLEGTWAAGLHFKSALLRMDAVHERAEKMGDTGKRRTRRRKTRARVGNPPAWCADWEAHKHLINVNDDAGRLKHVTLGTASGHKVKFEEAAEAFRELVELLKRVGSQIGALHP